jgi:hypothetical protein
MIGDPSKGPLVPIWSGEVRRFRKSTSSITAIRESLFITEDIAVILYVKPFIWPIHIPGVMS